jgi:hypothetical protein
MRHEGQFYQFVLESFISVACRVKRFGRKLIGLFKAYKQIFLISYNLAVINDDDDLPTGNKFLSTN